MSTWYEQAIFYHMYPLGITGAPKINVQTEVTDRFKELDQWIPYPFFRLQCHLHRSSF